MQGVASPAGTSLTVRCRAISLFEVLLGALLVIAHNVFHKLPNEVPILFVLFFVSLRLRDGRWKAPELQPPNSWGGTLIIAVSAAGLLQLGSELVIKPLASYLWHRPQTDSSVIINSAPGWKRALQNLAIVWTFAAFGEEIGYRGYLEQCAADLGNRSQVACIAAMLYVKVLFGFEHFFKDPGILDSACSGLVLGSAYLLTGSNLWA